MSLDLVTCACRMRPIPLLVAAAMVACGTSGGDPTQTATTMPSPSPEAGLVSLTLTEASYKLTWSDDEGLSAGESVDLISDLGYEVHLSGAYVVSYAAQLVPCDNSGSFRAVAPAGHGESDPSMVEAPTVEALAARELLPLGDVSFEATAYCGAHYLVGATSEPPPAHNPEPPDMTGAALYLKGTWRAPSGREDVPFELTSDYAFGAIQLFDTANVDVAGVGQGQAVQIVLAREVSTLMDGIELSEVSDETIAYRALINLLSHTRLSVIAAEQLRPAGRSALWAP